MDRASDYGSEGWGFDSLRARRPSPHARGRFPWRRSVGIRVLSLLLSLHFGRCVTGGPARSGNAALACGRSGSRSPPTRSPAGRSSARSSSHGDRADAEARCAELAADYAAHRRIVPGRAVRHASTTCSSAGWPAITTGGHRHGRATAPTPGRCAPIRSPRLRVARLDPLTVRAAIGRWRADGVTESVLSGRFRTLAAALGWAHQQRLIDRNPLDGMRGPPQPAPRLHAPIADVVRLLRHAEQLVDKARADADGGRRGASAASTAPNRPCCWCASPPTPAPVAANSPR